MERLSRSCQDLAKRSMHHVFPCVLVSLPCVSMFFQDLGKATKIRVTGMFQNTEKPKGFKWFCINSEYPENLKGHTFGILKNSSRNDIPGMRYTKKLTKIQRRLKISAKLVIRACSFLQLTSPSQVLHTLSILHIYPACFRILSILYGYPEGSVNFFISFHTLTLYTLLLLKKNFCFFSFFENRKIQNSQGLKS